MDSLISRQAAIDAIDVLKRNYPSSCFEDLCKAVDIAIKALSAQPEPRWIPVEIEPPKERNRYWVCTDTGYQCECRWTNHRFGMFELDEWGWSIFDIPEYTKVVAYMPLPKPYERSKDGSQN